MSAAQDIVDRATQLITETTTVEDSAIAMLERLIQAARDAPNPAALAEVLDAFEAKKIQLGDAVASVPDA